MIRTLVRRTLQARGYTVVDAASGDDALRAAAAVDSIDLLLTDMRMPGIQGRQLATMLRADRPGLPVVFMTGFDEDTARRSLEAGDGSAVITKPFSSHELARAIRQALDGRA